VVEDVRLASSEAATNVVENVFENRGGRIHVVVTPSEAGFTVVVADDGNRGLQPHRATGSRLAFVVMNECADEVAIGPTESGGIEIRLRFSFRGEAPDLVEPLAAARREITAV
jgi:anti-sigma regulatory factor (Ser/Thr protein kinase)